MTSVTQTIPSYTGGLSQQPDELKIPGQVSTAQNVIPDVTEGLVKRPGSQIVGSLMDNGTAALNSDHVGKWFHYYRDENEQYIGQIAKDGDVNMWSCIDGSSKTVHVGAKAWAASTAYAVGDKVKNNNNIYKCSTAGTSAGSGGPTAGSGTGIVDNTAKWDFDVAASSITNYLVYTSDEDLQTLTINDYTYITNRTKTVGMTAVAEALRPPEAYINLKRVAYASQFAVNLFDDTSGTPSSITTATRISADVVDPGHDPLLPNVGTEIINLDGTPAIHQLELDKGGTTTDVIGGEDGFYTLTDGVTTIQLETESNLTEGQSGANSSEMNVDSSEKLAEEFRMHNDYSKLKFSICTDAVKRANHYEINYGTKWRLVYKEGGTQTAGNVTLKRAASLGGTATNTYTATELTEGVASGVHTKKNLYFKVTTTGQAVPVPDFNPAVYLARYQVIVDLLHGGEGWTAGTEFEVGYRQSSIRIKIEKDSTSQNYANLGLVRPVPTSFDAQTVVTSESILGAIRTDILGTSNSGTNASYQWKDDAGNGYYCRQIGTGLYISRPSGQGTFNITTPNAELLGVLTDSIQDIAELPNQCRHGYVVKVANSEAEEDDYYLKFFGHNDRDGNGVWEECPKPGTLIEYDKTTLPVQLVRQADNSFILDHVEWDQAQVGDTAVGGTNPRASFVGKQINKLLFWRNRLAILSDENIILSRPGDFYNFWATSAITYTSSDVIDISCSAEYPAIIYDGLQVNAGLILFTKNQQFMLTTDSDILSPITAKINFISAYNFNYKTNPFSLGTTVGFLDNAGKHTRFMEMARTLREGEPDIIEQSKIVSKLLDKELDLVSNSRENGLAFFSEKNKTTLYVFKYFNASDKRVQQAWFTWEFKNKIVHHTVLDDALYLVTANSRTLTNENVTRSSNNLTLTNHGLAVGDTVVFHNGGGTVLTAGGSNVADNTTFYVSSVPDSNNFTISTAANTTVLTLGGGHANNYINYTSNKNVLQKIPLKLDTDSITVTDDRATTDTSDDITYKIHLDNMTTVASSSLSAYDATNDRTTFTIPTDFNLTSDLSAYVVPTTTDDTLQGLCQDVTVYKDGSNTKVSLPGNWKTYVDAGGTTQTPTNNIILGQKFDYEVKLPTIYYTTSEGNSYKSDRRGSLVLHRLKLNFGHSGLYETLVERTGKDDYSEIWEPSLANAYLANQVIFEQEITRTIPIYDRNSNTSVTIKSSHPSPATLYSMTWEGDYTNRFYKSV